MEPSPYYQPPTTYPSTPEGTGNLALATVAGLAAALVGAVLWATLVSATHFKIGYAAVGVGFLVGWVMRKVGKGRLPLFGYVGAVLALAGCVLGDLLTDCNLAATQVGVPLFEVLKRLTPSLALQALQEGFGVLDALFYVLAAMAAYRNAFIKS